MKRVQLVEQRPGWNENMIARAIAFSPNVNRKALLVVPRCYWTGNECDLLAIDRDSLRVVDIEIKISRADLKADAKKDKWWSHHWSRASQKRDWPPKVWKHYYAVPADIWKAELFAILPPASGVILLRRDRSEVKLDLIRRAKPNPKAKAIGTKDMADIARLAGLRMWEALFKLEPK